MSGRASQASSILIRLAVGAVLIAAILSPDTSSLLWRNALVLVPLTLAVALACRWLPCRPITKHAMWLALLVWPVAGLVLPPLSLGGGRENVPAGESPVEIAATPEPRPLPAEPAGETQSRPHRVRERLGRFSILESTDSVGMTPSDKSRRGADRPERLNEPADESGGHGSRLIDADLLSRRDDASMEIE